ncbi:MAG: tRNA preQ1(34) S-adenosylmethionine ribosyltransferase-isomerase QueA [Planctomycetes bacterium]|nr:tRNA preQ1(34) S-adenosylmethionine ribosyltransferase-isomerase QueA [Planctomycetota bacterium]
MQLADFEFVLPPELIAQEPVEPRDAARLLHAPNYAPTEGGAVEHRVFRELPELLRPGDLLVMNDSRVVPARFYGRRTTGGRVELFLLQRDGGRARALLRSRRALRPGEVIPLDGGTLEARFLARGEDGAAEVELQLAPGVCSTLEEELRRTGHVPLPPYIHRAEEGDPREERDRERYQTIYARSPGSVAAPTAGLHFTPELLQRLRVRGVEQAFVTLHVGRGTFEPVRSARIEDHRMHAEWAELPAATAERIATTRARGGRVIAVGTTSARVLESARRGGGAASAWCGWTELFLKPGDEVLAFDGLITNFHLPQSTLLLLVAALLGRQRLFELYGVAIERGYRFYSYGDAMLVWRPR